MFNKINPLALLAISALGAIIVYVLWTTDLSQNHHAENEEEQEHEEFIVLTPEQMQAAGIEIQTAAPGKIQKIIHSPGKIVLNADAIAHIHPKVAGIAASVRKNLGENVKEGELLAVLESREIAETKTAYITALKKQQLAETVLQQEQNLKDKHISSLQDYQNTVSASDSARLELELAKQHLQALGLTDIDIAALPDADPSMLRMYEIRSPFKGTVLSRHITNGELLQIEDEVFVIADLNKLWVEISLYPQDLQDMRKGQTIQITDSNGRNGKAELLYKSPIIDDDTRRAKAIALLDNSKGEWNPGTFVTANSGAETIAIPLLITKEAVQKVDGEDCAFIMTDSGFEIRPIKLGRSDGKCYEVLSGMEAGESYAAKNTFLLKAEHEKDEAEHMH